MTGKLRSLATLWRNRTLSPEQLQALQLRKLRAVVRAATRDVPFYRALYGAAGVDPERIRTMDEVREIPMVTKALMRAAGQDTVISARLASSCAETLHTSGTSGVPLSIPLAPADVRLRGLVDFRGLLSLGFRPWDTLVTVGPGFRRPPSRHERLGLFRTIVVSSEATLDEQIAQLQRLDPDILWCYPSELLALLHHASRPLERLRPRFLIVSGAVLDDKTRRQAESMLQCRIVLSYACMETGRIAIQCPRHDGLHVNADHVLLEIMNGDRPAPPGESGEVVLTTLNQSAMPFIRYRLGDLTMWLDEQCRCGSTLPLIRAPEGRIEQPLKFRGGQQQSPTRFFLALRELDGVERYLVVQETLDLIRVLVVPVRPLQAEALERVTQHLLDGMPSGVALEFVMVDHIDFPGGKFRQMLSKVAED